MKFGLDDLKKETLKLFTDYLGFPAEPAKPFGYNDNVFIQSPDFYNCRGISSNSRKPVSTRTP